MRVEISSTVIIYNFKKRELTHFLTDTPLLQYSLSIKVFIASLRGLRKLMHVEVVLNK